MERKLKEYRKSIQQAKEQTWKNFVETADETTIWQVKKYLDTITTTIYVPTLQEEATTNDQKADAFQKVFFPPPSIANISDINDPAAYRFQASCSFNITKQQIQTAIEKLAPNKAPGPDEISNKVLKECYDKIQNHILVLAKASLKVRHFPTCFKKTITTVLRKPNKSNYTKPNAYRPIVLENTIGKVLESVIAELLSYLTETFHLLPRNHFGGRPCGTTEDALTILTENIYAA